MSIIYDSTILNDINFSSPRQEDVFNALNMEYVKVCIIGEQPYGNKNDHGYALSSKYGLTNELKGIFKEINYRGCNGDLTSWVEQGVMLLNAYLTYPDKPKIWNSFIDDIIKQL